MAIEQKQGTNSSISVSGTEWIYITGFTGTPYAIVAAHIRSTSNNTNGWGGIFGDQKTGVVSNLVITGFSFSSGQVGLYVYNGSSSPQSVTAYVTASVP